MQEQFPRSSSQQVTRQDKEGYSLEDPPGLLSQETESAHRTNADSVWRPLRAVVPSHSLIQSSLHLRGCNAAQGVCFLVVNVPPLHICYGTRVEV